MVNLNSRGLGGVAPFPLPARGADQQHRHSLGFFSLDARLSPIRRQSAARREFTLRVGLNSELIYGLDLAGFRDPAGLTPLVCLSAIAACSDS